MEILIILSLVLGLYLKTWRYNYLIDDPVPRDGYLYELPRKVPYSFYDKRKSLMATVTNIAVFIANCLFVYKLWGFHAAVLFAVFPLNVLTVAWNTGNYYASTVLLILATHYCISMDNILYAFVGMAFYAAALNSTINALSYVFIAPLVSVYGWLMVFPFAMFLVGKRFKTGMGQRKKGNDNINISNKWKPKNLLHTPLLLGYYAFLTITLKRVGFFHDFNEGAQAEHATKKFLLASVVLNLAWAAFLYSVSPIMCLWWVASLIIFCHIQGMLGQYVTERYTTLSNVAFCVVLGTVLSQYPVLFTVVTTLYFCRSWNYVPAFRHNLDLFSHGVCNFPLAIGNYNNLSAYHIERGDYHSAIKPLLMCDRLCKGLKTNLYINITTCLFYCQMYDQALHYVKLVLLNPPKDEVEKFKDLMQKIEAKLKTSRKLIKEFNQV